MYLRDLLGFAAGAVGKKVSSSSVVLCRDNPDIQPKMKV
jgi:hypothetical protein